MRKEEFKESIDKIDINEIQKQKVLNNVISSNSEGGKNPANKGRQQNKNMYLNIACLVCIFLVGAIAITAAGIGDMGSPGMKTADKTGSKPLSTHGQVSVSQVEDYSELYNYLANLSINGGVKEGGLDFVRGPQLAAQGAVNGEESVANEGGSNSNSDTPDFSDTNLQVAGVQEADIIKTDGKYIYAVSTEYIYILSADNGKLKLLSKLKTENSMYTGLSEIYVTNNRLIVIGSIFEKVTYNNEYSQVESEEFYENESPEIAMDNEVDIGYGYYYDYTQVGVKAEIYDIEDRAKPELINTLGQDGYYVSSRMIGDVLYLLTNKYIYYFDSDKPETYVPQLYKNSEKELLSANDIYIGKEDTKSCQYLMISGIDTKGDTKIISTKSIFGCGSIVYSSKSSLYLTDYYSIQDDNTFSSGTKIFRFSIDEGNIELKAEGVVLGNPLNQFSMDEYDGIFRIVTTVNSYEYVDDHGMVSSNNFKQYNCIYALNDNLEIVGKLENLAEGERVYSVRFEGTTGYFVTFRQVDPLFTVDLSEPENLKIRSELKIPGFSEYLHKYSDGLLFGLGKDADEESGRAMELKLSMFDVSDVFDVTEKHKLIISNKFYSEAAYNHKAIVINSDRNIIAFPVDDEYLIYSYDKSDGFKKEASMKVEMFKSMRGLFIGDYMYVFSTDGISSYDMTNYSLYQTLNF